MKIIKFPDLWYYIMIQSDDDQVEEIGGEPQDRDRGSVSDDSKRKVTRTSFMELLKLNRPDWLFVLVDVVCSAFIGCLFPLIAIPFSEVLRVSSECGKE